MTNYDSGLYYYNSTHFHGANPWLSFYGGFVIIFGSIGNLCLGLILYYDRGLKTTTRLMFVILALGDTLVLWFTVFRYWFTATFGIDIRSDPRNNAWCKIHIMLVYSLSNFATGMLCILCVDRCLMLRSTLRHMVSSYAAHSKRYLLIAIAVLILVIILKHSVIAWKFDINQETGDCEEVLAENIHYYVDFSTNVVVAYMILIPVNVYVYILIQRHNSNMKHLETGGDSKSKSQNRLNSSSGRANLCVFKMLVTLSVLNFILTFPGYLLTQVINIRNKALNLSEELHQNLYNGLLMLSFTNNALPFYAFAITSARFRHSGMQFLFLFQRKCFNRVLCCYPKNATQPTSTVRKCGSKDIELAPTTNGGRVSVNTNISQI